MTCPGNHEWHYNFSNYKARFNMPGDENNNMFFSFDIGPVHFVSISTEFYYYLNYGMQQVIIKYILLAQESVCWCFNEFEYLSYLLYKISNIFQILRHGFLRRCDSTAGCRMTWPEWTAT